MTRIKTKQARDEFGSIVNRVAYGKERIVLVRRNREMAAIIPMEEFRILEQLIAREEDRLDAEAARTRKASPKDRVPYEKIRQEASLNSVQDRNTPDRKARISKAPKGRKRAAG